MIAGFCRVFLSIRNGDLDGFVILQFDGSDQHPVTTALNVRSLMHLAKDIML